MALTFSFRWFVSGMSLRLRFPLFSLGGALLTLASSRDLPRSSRLCLLDFYLLIRVFLFKSCQHFTTLQGFLVFYCLWTAWGVGVKEDIPAKITFIKWQWWERFNCLLKILIPTKVTNNWPSTVDLIKSVFKQIPIDFVETFVPGEGLYNLVWHSCPTLTW